MTDTQTLEEVLQRSSELQEAIAFIFSNAACEEIGRGRVTLGMCAISLEHAQSLRILIGSGLPSSAILLLRPQSEALIRATWLCYVATEEEISAAQVPLTVEAQKAHAIAARKEQSVDSMLASISEKGPSGAGRLLRRSRDRLWSGLNSYVHVGIHPLRRNEEGYPIPFIIDMVKNSNAFMLLVLLVIGVFVEDEDVVAFALSLHPEFADVLPALEPFPE